MAQRGGTDERTYGKSPHSTGEAAALPPPMKTKEKVEQSKGTADHLVPLGYLSDIVSREVSLSVGGGRGENGQLREEVNGSVKG